MENGLELGLTFTEKNAQNMKKQLTMHMVFLLLG